jgi:hypothetical protein
VAGRASWGGLAPFLAALSRPEQRRWAPLYLKGLLLPGERKSVEPMAARVAPGDVQQLHHFVSASPWATGPLEAELVRAADKLVRARRVHTVDPCNKVFGGESPPPWRSSHHGSGPGATRTARVVAGRVRRWLPFAPSRRKRQPSGRCPLVTHRSRPGRKGGTRPLCPGTV